MSVEYKGVKVLFMVDSKLIMLPEEVMSLVVAGMKYAPSLEESQQLVLDVVRKANDSLTDEEAQEFCNWLHKEVAEHAAKKEKEDETDK